MRHEVESSLAEVVPPLGAKLISLPNIILAIGVAAIVTPSTTAALTCNRYHINVYFSEDFVVENVFAIEAPMGGVPYQCLIGRDILRLATLIYAGQRDEFTLEF